MLMLPFFSVSTFSIHLWFWSFSQLWRWMWNIMECFGFMLQTVWLGALLFILFYQRLKEKHSQKSRNILLHRFRHGTKVSFIFIGFHILQLLYPKISYVLHRLSRFLSYCIHFVFVSTHKSQEWLDPNVPAMQELEGVMKEFRGFGATLFVDILNPNY